MNQVYTSMTQQMLQAFQGQHLETAERLARAILKMSPKDVVALQVHGLSLAMQGRIAESVAPLYKASQLDQKNPELLSNLAKAQQEADLYEDAIQTYKKLDRLIPNNAQILTDMGTALAKSKFYDEAEALFNRAIEIQPEYFLAWSNRGNLLAENGCTYDALASYENALNLKSDYAESWTNYGNALFDLGRYKEARLAHERALELDPNYAEAWSNYGNTLLELKDARDYDAYKKAFALKPEHPFLLGQLLNAATSRCDWENSQYLTSNLLLGAEEGKKVAHPFVFLQTNASLKLQKFAAEIFIEDRAPYLKDKITEFSKGVRDAEKIRIGYFSSDLKEHPVGILIENILKTHDRERFEIFGFFLNAVTGDILESRLLKSFDAVFNLHGVGDLDATNLILAEKLDIAIDLNGHTSGARTALFARKLAPIQVNYLGYAGTSGAGFYDALVADKVAATVEVNIWSGATATAGAFDGFEVLLAADAALPGAPRGGLERGRTTPAGHQSRLVAGDGAYPVGPAFHSRLALARDRPAMRYRFAGLPRHPLELHRRVLQPDAALDGRRGRSTQADTVGSSSPWRRDALRPTATSASADPASSDTAPTW